ncbi:hypothetical protein STRDD10_02022 [Streptococcus sp. DD10]|nr:hypothetical protein STRDD10_02022 [Streptococcus sp. DD10]
MVPSAKRAKEKSENRSQVLQTAEEIIAKGEESESSPCLSL